MKSTKKCANTAHLHPQLDPQRQTCPFWYRTTQYQMTAFLINCAVAWALAPSTLLAPVPTTLACRRAVGLALSELKVTTFAPTASPSASGVSPLRQRLAQLARIAEEHGVAAPSVQFGHDASLVRWATRQRTLRRQGSLSQDVIDQLDTVSFVWDPLEHQWQLRYEELEAFFAAHGHSNVPSAYAPSPPLGTWVGRQRVLYRSDALPIRRRDALLALGFEFDPLAARFEEGLAAYAAALSTGEPLPDSLRRWAARQREARASGRLTAERVEALNELPGWQWTPAAARRPSALRALGRRLANELGLSEEATARPAHHGPTGPPVPEPKAGLAYGRCASAGRALVISVGLGRESGASAELGDAREALRALGYTVRCVENPSASELHASLLAHGSEPGWEAHGSSVVALMAHGSEAALLAQDGRRSSLRMLFGALAPRAAPALEGKPKVFLIQACRRGEASMLSFDAGDATRSSEAGARSLHSGLFGAQLEAGTPDDGQQLDAIEKRSCLAENLPFLDEAMAEGLPFLDDAESDEGPWRGVHADGVHADGMHADGVHADGMHLCEEHDFLWGYATTPGTVAYRGAMFAALRRVVAEFGPRTSWLELLQHTNEQLCAWSANRPAELAISSMEIRSTCRGAAFGPADLVWGLEDAHEDASEDAAALPDAAESCR